MQTNQPIIWLRYIDDMFFIWTHGEKELEKFTSSFDSFTLNLKFTYESSKKDISFLDLKVSLTKGKLSTDLHIKAADCHQYLHYSSGHPEHTKRSIVYSQLLRVSRICSRENDFNRHKSNMKIWFQKRGYLQNIIENEMKKVKFPSCNKAQRKNSKGIAFVVTYHPLLKHYGRNMYLLNMNVEVKQTFTPVPMVSYRSSRKLSRYLVRETEKTINDVNSEVAISPSHILTIKSKVVMPPPGVLGKPDLYCRRRWRRIQHISNEFWSR